MKDLVEYLAKALVDDPEPVRVFAGGTDDEAVFRVKVGPDDLGKVIGKKGRTAKALRTLLAAAGAKQNQRVTLEIVEPGEDLVPAPDDTSDAAADDTPAADASAADAA